MKSDKTGRNELCSCGSGQKFKRCCLGKSEEGLRAWGWSAVLVLMGVVGGVLIGLSKGLVPGFAIFAASILFGVGVYVIRDPAPARGTSGDASAINFGAKK